MVVQRFRGDLGLFVHLHASPPTAPSRRRCSLSALLDDVRAELARRHLGGSRESIAEVAFMLGFSEVSTFHRAFKRWTGVTPSAYRRGDHGANSAS